MPINDYYKNYDEWSLSYDNYVKKNNIKDGDFWKPFFKDLIRDESSYKRTNISENGKGSYQGWYQLHKNELHGNFDQDFQHKKAFDHLNSILSLLTVDDLKKSREKGWSDFAFVQKMWNQGRHPLYYLYHNVHNVDGNGTPIATYGYTQDHVDISDKVKGVPLKRNDYAIVGEEGITNMSIAGNRSRHILPKILRIDPISKKVYRKSPTDSILKLNPNLDPNKLQIGDTIWLNPEHKIYKFGGRFTPKKSKLVKNAEEQNSKRDMRKKFIKSDRPTYTNNRVKKNQSGGVLSVDPSIFVSWNNISTSNIKLPEVDYTPKSNLDRFLERTENSVSINLLGNPKEQEEKQDQKEIPVSKEEPIVKKTPLANPSKGNDAFNKIYDELISEMPDAAEYRDFLTTVAKYESGFDSRAKNKYAPAWGYFQFMQDDNKYNNIKSYAGVDTQTFLNNPKLQIRAAINLAKAMEKGFTKEDIEAAKSKGISRWGMLGGAWLGGNGGLRKYLLQNINSSDKHWNPEGKGIDMENQIRRYNF